MVAKTIYVKGLDSKVQASDLGLLFKNCGIIKSILINKGYGVLEFKGVVNEDTLHKVTKKKLFGKRITLTSLKNIMCVENNKKKKMITRKKKCSKGRYHVFLQNLPTCINAQYLKQYMTRFGQVIYAKLHQMGQMSGNVGVVCFSSRSAVIDAIRTLNNTQLKGYQLHVFHAYKDNLPEYSTHHSFYYQRRCSTNKARKLYAKPKPKWKNNYNWLLSYDFWIAHPLWFVNY